MLLFDFSCFPFIGDLSLYYGVWPLFHTHARVLQAFVILWAFMWGSIIMLRQFQGTFTNFELCLKGLLPVRLEDFPWCIWEENDHLIFGQWNVFRCRKMSFLKDGLFSSLCECFCAFCTFRVLVTKHSYLISRVKSDVLTYSCMLSKTP